MVAAVLFALGFVLTFFVFLHTTSGLHADAALYRRVSHAGTERVQTVGGRALGTIDIVSVLVASAVIALVAAARGRVARAAAAVATVAISVVSVEALKHGLPRLAEALPAGRMPSFPSGHAAVAVSLGLALVLAVPSVLRPLAALIGAAYAAAIGFSSVALGAHYPSDVVASFFVCGFWACVMGLLSRGVARRPSLSLRGVLLALVLMAIGLFAAAVLAGRHPGAVAAARSYESLVVTAALFGILSLAISGAIAALVGEASDERSE